MSPNMQVPPPPLPAVARVTPRPAQDPQLQPPLHDPHHHQQHQIVTGFTNLNINDVSMKVNSVTHFFNDLMKFL